MKNINQTALNMHFGLFWGLSTLKECIEFADRMIADNETVPYEIIALSLSATPKEAMSAIEPLIKDADNIEAIRCALGRMHYLGLQKSERLYEFANLLYQYAMRKEIFDIDNFSLTAMGHEYEIADVMGFSNENADKEFIAELSVFKRENCDKADWFVV